MSLRDELAQIAGDAELDVVDRSVQVLALVSEALRPLGVRPVLVGGMAVRFWTPADEFATFDIDLVMDEPPEADGVLADLGFTRSRDGRHWEIVGTDVSIELPGRRLPDGAEVANVRLQDGRTAQILSQVDVLVVRLEELGIGPREDVSRQVLALIPNVDRKRLRARVASIGFERTHRALPRACRPDRIRRTRSSRPY